ncbi:Glycoside hydrolase family 43 [Penicillium argentinense]|uniref:Glycoside hydrolase family 43 n=1 Tax=Penicillium argentinense TaxID=1131581 RepID=A0A9W9KAS5_9EURO|nr:Glycoside hydrolase family 43 [Penicillium argentinense]KAJ5099464.1 Glycoside hydrolase family 43 [Penicillium argentinense]
MRNFFSPGRPSEPSSPAAVSAQPDNQLSDTEGSQATVEPKQLEANDAASEKKGLLARPWTRRDIGILSSLVFLGLGLIAVIIALPIVYTRDMNQDMGDVYNLYNSKHEDPSYHMKENHPVFGIHNFPDPGLIEHNGTWYAFGTNPKKHDPNTIHIPVATSTNFVNWTLHHDYDAMPTIGNWEKEVNHWAPDVIQRDDGKFVLYYSGQTKNFDRHHCIGAAVSTSTDPMGPYIPLNESLACPHEYGGAIDPSPFKDADGKLYVVYKGDGNSVGRGGYCGNSIKPLHPVPLILQELESNGFTKVGEPKIILDIDDSDGPLIEAPDIIRTDDGTYYLAFSSHCFTSLGYNVKYAHAKSVKGPYTRVDRPLLQTTDFGLEAPGGATLSKDGTKMVFHANCGGWRCMYASAIDIRSHNSTIVLASLDLEISKIGTTTSVNLTS